MNWNANEILDCYTGVSIDAKTMTIQQVEEKYKYFMKDHSRLYQAALNSCRRDYGEAQIPPKLLMMLKARDDMMKGKLSKMATDMYVGNQLGKEYIYPKVETPSHEELINAAKRLSQQMAERPADQ
jgi:hypothetical protein